MTEVSDFPHSFTVELFRQREVELENEFRRILEVERKKWSMMLRDRDEEIVELRTQLSLTSAPKPEVQVCTPFLIHMGSPCRSYSFPKNAKIAPPPPVRPWVIFFCSNFLGQGEWSFWVPTFLDFCLRIRLKSVFVRGKNYPKRAIFGHEHKLWQKNAILYRHFFLN